jgi:hypothetical protein
VCIVLSAANEAIITDSGHEDPSWIDCWETVVTDRVVQPDGYWAEHDPPDIHTGLHIAWLAGAVLPEQLGAVYVKGSSPAEANCLKQLIEFAKVVGIEFKCAYNGVQAVEPRFIVSTEDDVWPILWVNVPWVSLTEVSTGNFWGNFTLIEKHGDEMMIAPKHKPLLHLKVRLWRCSPYMCFVGVVMVVNDNDIYSLNSSLSSVEPDSVFHVSAASAESASSSKEGSSTVRRATWRSADVALKIVYIDTHIDCSDVVTALHASSSISHQNITRVMAADVRKLNDHQEVWVVSEWCTGKTLSSAVKDDFFFIDGTMQLDFYKILLTCKQISQGLACLHENGLKHGNLHSRNVMICADRSVKVCDYGMWRLVPILNLTTDETTICHLAPEQLHSNQVHTKTDQYAIGILMYEMLLGHPVWFDAPHATIVQKKLDNSFPPLPIELPPSLREFVQSCTTYHHTDRPSWTEVLRQLDDMLEQILAL